jgi:hypothetical protein
LKGVTADRKGLMAERAVKTSGGVVRGIPDRNGTSNEGVERCNEHRRIQPSSALRLACSHALRANSLSIVPPGCPLGAKLTVVSQVLTARLVPDSS